MYGCLLWCFISSASCLNENYTKEKKNRDYTDYTIHKTSNNEIELDQDYIE